MILVIRSSPSQKSFLVVNFAYYAHFNSTSVEQPTNYWNLNCVDILWNTRLFQANNLIRLWYGDKFIDNKKMRPIPDLCMEIQCSVITSLYYRRLQINNFSNRGYIVMSWIFLKETHNNMLLYNHLTFHGYFCFYLRDLVTYFIIDFMELRSILSSRAQSPIQNLGQYFVI